MRTEEEHIEAGAELRDELREAIRLIIEEKFPDDNDEARSTVVCTLVALVCDILFMHVDVNEITVERYIDLLSNMMRSYCRDVLSPRPDDATSH